MLLVPPPYSQLRFEHAGLPSLHEVLPHYSGWPVATTYSAEYVASDTSIGVANENTACKHHETAAVPLAALIEDSMCPPNFLPGMSSSSLKHERCFFDSLLHTLFPNFRALRIHSPQWVKVLEIGQRAEGPLLSIELRQHLHCVRPESCVNSVAHTQRHDAWMHGNDDAGSPSFHAGVVCDSEWPLRETTSREAAKTRCLIVLGVVASLSIRCQEGNTGNIRTCQTSRAC